MKRITEVWTFSSIDPSDNCEGLIGIQSDLGWVPLVAADPDRVSLVREVACQVAKATGRTVLVKRFTTMTLEETIEP